MGLWSFFFNTQRNIDALEAALVTLKATHSALTDLSLKIDNIKDSLADTSVPSKTFHQPPKPSHSEKTVAFSSSSVQPHPLVKPINRQQTPFALSKKPTIAANDSESDFDDIDIPALPTTSTSPQFAHRPSHSFIHGQFLPTTASYNVQSNMWIPEEPQDDAFEGFSDEDADDFAEFSKPTTKVPDGNFKQQLIDEAHSLNSRIQV
ncbi:hypothetical protein GEMRC1_007862 [Eukaryota sp. GEM-RC1]